MKTWANGGGGASALALLARGSGASEVALTVATIKKKLMVFSNFCNASTGSPNIYNSGAGSPEVGTLGQCGIGANNELLPVLQTLKTALKMESWISKLALLLIW